MTDKPKKWEAVDEPWMIPTNSKLGANYVGTGKLFAEHFLGKQHTASEFAEWVATLPEFAGRTDFNVIRNGLVMAGYRQDMPEPYDIVRVAKQVWEVRPMIKAIYADPIMAPVLKALQRQLELLLDRMRASDLTQLTPRAYSDLIMLFDQFRSAKNHLGLYGSDIHRLQQRVQLSLIDKQPELPPGETPLLDI